MGGGSLSGVIVGEVVIGGTHRSQCLADPAHLGQRKSSVGVQQCPSGPTMPTPAPLAYHRWRDVESVPIHDQHRVDQSAVEEPGALPSRLHQHLSRYRG